MSGITLLEFAVVAAASGPAGRLLFNKSTRRVAPGLFAALLLMVAIFIGGALYLGRWHPDWLHALALVTAVLLAATWWRARVAYGASRRLPPGSLSFTRSIEAIVDRRFYRDRFARHGQIFKMTRFHHRTICILGFELGHRLLREHTASLGPTEPAFTRDVEGGFLRYMDAANHQKYGGLFRAAFSAPVVETASAGVMTTVKGAIESQFGGRSGSAMGSDALRDFCQQLAHLAMVRLVFDLESGTPLFERYDEARLIFARVAPERAPTEENRTVFEQLRAVVIEQTECIRQRTRTGCSSSSALEEILRLDPDQPDATTIDNLIFVTRVGSGNVGSYLAWQLVMLGRHPEWSARLRDELTSGVAPETPNLTRRIIMETLRLEQSEYLYRKITNDFTAEGYLFPKEWLVRLCVRESHRWGDVFENPDVFDPDRFARRKFRSSEYSPFGFDHHACLGVAAIHLIGAAVIENLVRDLDWTVVVDGPPTREFRHWKHWRPGRATMLEFRPVANGPTPLPRSSEAGDS